VSNKTLIDYDTYKELADDISDQLMNLLFRDLLPKEDEEYDPEFTHKKCAETEDAIRIAVREELECYFRIDGLQ
jgi:hypothetical protein